jgi:hypothetical protein
MALPPNARVIAEGDSWFDYPPRQLYTPAAQDSADPEGYEANRRDVLKCLKAPTVNNQPAGPLAYNVESVAAAGDRVEDMAYGGPQSPQLAELEQRIGEGPTPTAVLLSGGGIDLVAVDGGAGTAFGMLLNHARSAVVLAGQYDYPVPDGSFTTFQGPQFAVPPGCTEMQAGPSLGPGFMAKGYGEVEVGVHLTPQPPSRQTSAISSQCA